MNPKKKLRLYGKNEPRSIDDLLKGRLIKDDLFRAQKGIEPNILAAYSKFKLYEDIIQKSSGFKGFLETMLGYCFVPINFASGGDEVKKTFNLGFCAELYKESDDPNQDSMYGRVGKPLTTIQIVDEWVEDVREYMRLDNHPYSLNLKRKVSDKDPMLVINPKILSKDDYAFTLFYNFGIGDKSEFIDRFKLIIEEEGAAKKIVLESIEEAIKRGASDVHIAPYENKIAKVKLRVDGVLTDLMEYPLAKQPAVINVIKGFAGSGMDISESRLPQDGKIKGEALKTQIDIEKKSGGRSYNIPSDIDIRVSTSRTTHAQKAVLRFFGSSQVSTLDELGFSAETLARYKALLLDTNGILLSTGPTGSGKSATLSTSLRYLVKLTNGQKNILTAENPVEQEIAGTHQHSIDYGIELDVPKVLRSFLRQDPDIIMIGEIRDKETAEIATQASQTGHLVFSTLHTNDAPQAINRLLTWGLEPYLVADTLRGVMGQRLARRICNKCNDLELNDEDKNNIGNDEYFKTRRGNEISKFYMTSEEKRKSLKRFIVGKDQADYIESILQIPFKKIFSRQESEGCKNCLGLGYKGRTAISELMVIDDNIRGLIISGSKENEFKKYELAINGGMVPIVVDGLIKAAGGITSLAEVSSNVNSIDIVKYQPVIRRHLTRYVEKLKV